MSNPDNIETTRDEQEEVDGNEFKSRLLEEYEVTNELMDR